MDILLAFRTDGYGNIELWDGMADEVLDSYQTTGLESEQEILQIEVYMLCQAHDNMYR